MHIILDTLNVCNKSGNGTRSEPLLVSHLPSDCHCGLRAWATRYLVMRQAGQFYENRDIRFSKKAKSFGLHVRHRIIRSM
jgi:hypothetical protein